jgi:hypothetical protein
MRNRLYPSFGRVELRPDLVSQCFLYDELAAFDAPSGNGDTVSWAEFPFNTASAPSLMLTALPIIWLRIAN